MDLFNKQALIRLRETLYSSEFKIYHLTVENDELETSNIKLREELAEANKKIDNIKQSSETDSCISFYIDDKLNVRTETRINKDMADVLVREGYIDEKDIPDEEAQHIAYLAMANEITSQLINQYEGRPIDEKELKDGKLKIDTDPNVDYDWYNGA